MAETQHIEWLKEGVKCWNARRERIKFSPDLSNFDFSEILPWDFRETPKASKYFESINLKDCNLRSAKLSNLNFQKAKFDRSNLDKADISKSNFSKASFKNCSIKGGNLARSDFSDAVFINVNLENVVIENTILPRAAMIFGDTLRDTIDILNSNDVFVSESKEEYAAAMNEHGVIASYSGRVEIPIAPRDDKLIRLKDTARYDVYFGTNRTPEFFHGAIVDFDGSEDSQMHYGLAEVYIPNSRPIGQLGKKFWKMFLPKASRTQSEIERLISLDETLFWQKLLDVSNKSRNPAGPTIFVHGFRTTFGESIVMAAELGHDLGIGTGIGCFSWPSKGHPLKYLADEAASESSKHALADFIESFQKNSDSGPINLIAHSMGTRCLIGAIEILASRNSPVVERIGNVILAAADFDSNLMTRILAKISAAARRITSYVSDKDTALKFSTQLHANSRIGFHPPIFVELGMDTIVVNGEDLGMFGHQYIVKSRTVLSDIYNILKHDHGPDDRHSLVRKSSKKYPYWEIKD